MRFPSGFPDNRLTSHCRAVLEDAARRARVSAREEATVVELLAALAAAPSTVGGAVLREVCHDADELARAMAAYAGQQGAGGPVWAAEVLNRAVDEARTLGHHYIGTEHVLLSALQRLPDDLGARLAEIGVTSEAARQSLRNLLAGPGGANPLWAGARFIRFTLDDFPARYREKPLLLEVLEMLGFSDMHGNLKLAEWGVPPPPEGSSPDAARSHAWRWLNDRLDDMLAMVHQFGPPPPDARGPDVDKPG